MATFLLPQVSSGSTARRATPSWDEALVRFAQILSLWHERARQRRHLQTLSDHMLRDIGLTRADVCGECSKPFWRA